MLKAEGLDRELVRKGLALGRTEAYPSNLVAEGFANRHDRRWPGLRKYSTPYPQRSDFARGHRSTEFLGSLLP